MKNRTAWLSVILGGLAFWSSLVNLAHADFPDRPVHLYVGFAPGGGTDILARLIAQKLSEKWGQPVIVENKPGADGTIADDIVAHSPPDGLNLVMVAPSHTVTPAQRKLNYDPVKGFTAVSMLAAQPDVLVVSPSSPINSVRDLIALAKSKTGALNFGSAGPGTPVFLEMTLFMKLTGTNMVNVSYSGIGPTIAALLGNEIQTMFEPQSTVMEQVKAGKLKGLAITSASRSALLPELPTMVEAADLKGFENGGIWYGIVAPGGTPKPVVAKLHDDLVVALHTPEVEQTLGKQGFRTIGNSPEEFDKFLTGEIAKWETTLKDLNLK